ncbi:MAG TPA: protein kinase [Pyrinomonadaceae bacterium]|nr:protein kinase [Pyrinomonadaceae bacterium]
MQGLENYVGQTLDDKYRLEQLLGQGGMGAVYLATHLGTDRYVALKLIAPRFMRNAEFVERFKREARAAGRLRHPNVVDVTDFGFSRVKEGQVAYLVMEYLDGCTLGDILSEENHLPLEWVVDILEQVCSAVHEAHQLGIIHRDLKPDNIWLEPNRLGSYRVKVLDFGIAKLGESAPATSEDDPVSTIIDDVSRIVSLSDAAEGDEEVALEAKTLLNPSESDHQNQHRQVNTERAALGTALKKESTADAESTKLFSAGTVTEKPRALTQEFASAHPEDADGTLLFEQGTHSNRQTAGASTHVEGAALTRVGAIMGTPLYMSPEQCGGGQVDIRSDIYSLGVIAYQMLAGEPPFSGNTSTVMRAHREETARHLHDYEVKIPKRVAGVVMAALSKDPNQRPQTAFAFASSLRGQAEGISALYRRAFSLYSEYFPKFVKLSIIAHLPVIAVAALMICVLVADKMFDPVGKVQKGVMISVTVLVGLLQIAAYFVAAGVISGVTAIIVTQLSAAPLRPVKLRVAFAVLRRRWKPFLKTMVRITFRIIFGYILFFIPGIVMSIRYALYAPVVLIEGLEKKAAMRRARELASRSWRTVIIVSILQILIPICVSLLLGRIRVGVSQDLKQANLGRQISQQILGLANIFVVPLMSIVPALLYLKMRQLGGETLSAAMAQMEEVDVGRRLWQQRMRTRLSLYTPSDQKTTG